jgi:hypothetical protein
MFNTMMLPKWVDKYAALLSAALAIVSFAYSTAAQAQAIAPTNAGSVQFEAGGLAIPQIWIAQADPSAPEPRQCK